MIGTYCYFIACFSLSFFLFFSSSLFFVFTYFTLFLTSLVAQMVKHLPTMRETRVHSLDGEGLLEKEMATHSSIHAWRIPGMAEPGELPALGSHRVGHDWSDLAAAAASIPTGKSHGRRSLVSYSPCGHKESDTIERLHFHFHSFLSCSLMVHLILCLYNLVFVHLL